MQNKIHVSLELWLILQARFFTVIFLIYWWSVRFCFSDLTISQASFFFVTSVLLDLVFLINLLINQSSDLLFLCNLHIYIYIIMVCAIMNEKMEEIERVEACICVVCCRSQYEIGEDGQRRQRRILCSTCLVPLPSSAHYLLIN